MMDPPKSNESYKDANYWNERYKNEESYEWFRSYEDFRHLIKEFVFPEDRILMLGCGNSVLSEDMYEDGFCNIVNIDYSAVVIENMRKKSDVTQAMEWHVMDARKLDFPRESFDVVIEKGTLDAMMAGEKSVWNISQETVTLIDTVLIEVSRVLGPKGKFISITFAQPHFRLPLYAHVKYSWDIDYFTFGETFHYFLYLLSKGKELKPGLQKTYERNNANTVVWLEENHSEEFLQRICLDDS